MTELQQSLQTLTLIVASVTLLITLFVIGVVALRVVAEFVSRTGQFLCKRINSYFDRLG